jgi:hypothetical protein
MLITSTKAMILIILSLVAAPHREVSLLSRLLAADSSRHADFSLPVLIATWVRLHSGASGQGALAKESSVCFP